VSTVGNPIFQAVLDGLAVHQTSPTGTGKLTRADITRIVRDVTKNQGYTDSQCMSLFLMEFDRPELKLTADQLSLLNLAILAIRHNSTGLIPQQLQKLHKISAALKKGMKRSAVPLPSASPSVPYATNVYSLCGNDIMINHNALTGRGTITAKTGPNSYLKFRDVLIISPPVPVVPPNDWISVGVPPTILLNLTDLFRELAVHNDPDKFGPFREVMKKFSELMCVLETQPLQKIVESTPVPGKGKITTEMGSTGDLRVVEKSPVGEGSSKRVASSVVVPSSPSPSSSPSPIPGPSTLARAKMKDPPTEAQRLAEFQKEARLSQFFISQGVPHIIPISISPAQDIRKIRLDMPLLGKQSFREKIALEPMSPTVYRQRLNYAIQAAETLEGIHNLGYTHSDIKPANIFYNPVTDTAAVADLGSVHKVGEKSSNGTYPAPEAASSIPDTCLESPATIENDLWAFGVTLFALLHGKAAGTMIHRAAWDKSLAGILSTRDLILAELNKKVPMDPADEIIRGLLLDNPKARPRMGVVLACLRAI
jgi:serine/threonine protein kinase